MVSRNGCALWHAAVVLDADEGRGHYFIDLIAGALAAVAVAALVARQACYADLFAKAIETKDHAEGQTA